MSIVIQLASYAAAAYLSYSFYQTGSYVYSLWTPPTCDPTVNAADCYCPSYYAKDVSIHFEIYLSPKASLQQNFQSSSQFQRVYSSALPPSSDDADFDAMPASPVRLSFDSKPIHHKTSINGKHKLFKLHQSKEPIYAHIVAYNAPQKSSDYYYTSSLPTDSIFSQISIPVTYLDPPPPDTFSLQTMRSGKQKQSKPSPAPSRSPLRPFKVQYFQPNLTVFYVVDANCYPIRAIPGDMFPFLTNKRSLKNGQYHQSSYDPIIFSSNLFQMHKYALPMMDASGDLLSNTNHTDFQYDITNLTLEINIEPVSLGLFRLYLMMDGNNRAMQREWGFTQHDCDQIKSLFVDTPPLLTFATFTAAMLHSIFGVLAMKSDISFWSDKEGVDSLKGLSTNSVLFECISSVIITIYLVDSDQTNKIVIAFMIAECILGFWKVKRIHTIKKKIAFKASIEDYEISDDELSSDEDEDESDDSSSSEAVTQQKKKKKKKQQKKKKKKKQQTKQTTKGKQKKKGNGKKQTQKQQKQKKEEEKKADAGLKNETESLDQRASRYMMMVMVPIVIGYGVYSFLYQKHKSVLSFIINVAASCVYGLGFIHLTPQLFINYELKSVEALPWKVLIYRFFNTFVDDLFSFVIDMPLMHRLACFRDDIVFFVFLGQWWIYGAKKRKTD
eukprot:CAMPEP_0197076398 /NCGR_PEP_ID=MMETSP1384-20130603/212095_1 /TAXON_ID=29189 /ORGANISM="Ammonia sp." /LENGTH=667 /DNA_ID=CAMNT_0042515253 /DNA_START=24 /DNA_END=2027 /DNA_ORIENTATION=+